jgi:hypothetical protein
VMAWRDDSLPSPLQRDDDPPHVGTDVNAGGTGTVAQTPGAAAPTPFQIAMTVLYRGYDMWQTADGKWQFVHEPSFQLLEAPGTFSMQEAITLVNSQWMPPWNDQIEVGLSAFTQQQIVPKLSVSGGAQLQATYHFSPVFSVNATLTGTYTPPAGGGTTGTVSLTGGAGITITLDSFSK